MFPYYKEHLDRKFTAEISELSRAFIDYLVEHNSRAISAHNPQCQF
jgi:hypothetical protein